MPLTIAAVADSHGGKQPSAPDIHLALTLTPDTSYPQATGGYDFDPAEQLRQAGNYDKVPELKSVHFQTKAGHTLEYDRVAKKVKIFTPAGAELADTADALAALGGPVECSVFCC